MVPLSHAAIVDRDLDDEARLDPGGLGRLATFVGESPAIQRVYELIRRVAPTDATVLITGETGSGKEIVARTLHALSRRSNEPFIPLDCGAVSPTLIESELFGHERGSFTGADGQHRGYFERACGGTLFLDEVTEMPLELQAKLLRVLETSVVERVGGNGPIRVDARNVRELRNVVQRAFILAEEGVQVVIPGPGVSPQRQLESSSFVSVPVGTPLVAAERMLIQATLDAMNGDKTKAAAALEISLKTLYNRLNEYKASPGPRVVASARTSLAGPRDHKDPNGRRASHAMARPPQTHRVLNPRRDRSW